MSTRRTDGLLDRAEATARALGHEVLFPIHLLLMLLLERSSEIRSIFLSYLSAQQIGEVIEELRSEYHREGTCCRHTHLASHHSPETATILSWATDIANGSGHAEVGHVDLLLALLKHPSHAREVLEECGLTYVGVGAMLTSSYVPNKAARLHELPDKLRGRVEEYGVKFNELPPALAARVLAVLTDPQREMTEGYIRLRPIDNQENGRVEISLTFTADLP